MGSSTLGKSGSIYGGGLGRLVTPFVDRITNRWSILSVIRKNVNLRYFEPSVFNEVEFEVSCSLKMTSLMSRIDATSKAVKYNVQETLGESVITRESVWYEI